VLLTGINPGRIPWQQGDEVMLSHRVNLLPLLAVVALGANGVRAAGPDVCAAVPIATVNELTHQNLSGVRADVSEEAHSYGCAYGAGGLVSVSVIRPGGATAFSRTISRFPNATPVPGLGDKAVYDKRLGTIALFGDMAFDAFVPPGTMTDAQTAAIEKSLILALRGKL
jgi:hypothetical protein